LRRFGVYTCGYEPRCFLDTTTNVAQRNPPPAESIKNAGAFRPNPKKIKIFHNSLTPYFITAYLFSVFSVSSVVRTFFASNLQVRNIIEGDVMSPYIWNKVCNLPAVRSAAKTPERLYLGSSNELTGADAAIVCP